MAGISLHPLSAGFAVSALPIPVRADKVHLHACPQRAPLHLSPPSSRARNHGLSVARLRASRGGLMSPPAEVSDRGAGEEASEEDHSHEAEGSSWRRNMLDEDSGLGMTEKMEPQFYQIGYERQVRAYGLEFREGPGGCGVFAAKTLPQLQRPRVAMEIPLETMLSVSAEYPWTFYPDLIPVGHPVFDVIEATDPKTDWDLRLACVLLHALDHQGSFWESYQDYLPPIDDNPFLLLASPEELQELQNGPLVAELSGQRERVQEFYHKYWADSAPLKLRRLAKSAEEFLWAVGVVWSRSFSVTINVGSLVQQCNLLIPYADMMNHSFQPRCSYRWRRKDQMLEVLLDAGQEIYVGDELTLPYVEAEPNETLVKKYGFSCSESPWDSVRIVCDERIHRDSFLSLFDIEGRSDEYRYCLPSAEERRNPFQDGLLLAAARVIPLWSEGDLPGSPAQEQKAAQEIQRHCRQLLAAFPTSLEEDQELWDKLSGERRRQWCVAVKYRMDKKMLLQKVVDALEIYAGTLFY